MNREAMLASIRNGAEAGLGRDLLATQLAESEHVRKAPRITRDARTPRLSARNALTLTLHLRLSDQRRKRSSKQESVQCEAENLQD